MEARSVRGAYSIVAGAISIFAVCVARYYESLRGTSSAYLLSAIDRLGLVKNPDAGVQPELRRPSFLVFTDETALQALLSLGVFLGLASIFLALFAEYGRESRSHFSAGFICGSGGLVLASPSLGVFGMAAGAVALLSLRHVRGA